MVLNNQYGFCKAGSEVCCMSKITLVTPEARSNGVHSHPGRVCIALVSFSERCPLTTVDLWFAVDTEHSDSTLDVCSGVAGCS